MPPFIPKFARQTSVAENINLTVLPICYLCWSYQVLIPFYITVLLFSNYKDITYVMLLLDIWTCTASRNLFSYNNDVCVLVIVVFLSRVYDGRCVWVCVYVCVFCVIWALLPEIKLIDWLNMPCFRWVSVLSQDCLLSLPWWNFVHKHIC